MKKRMVFLLVSLVLIASWIPVCVFAQGNYVASRNSDVFHDPDCSYVDSIKESNKIWFDTIEEALASGRRGCSRCNPTAGNYAAPKSNSGSSQSTSSYTDGFNAGEKYGYEEGYADGKSDWYDLGKEAGYKSGYSDGEKDMKAEMDAKIDKAEKDAAQEAYSLAFIIGAPIVAVLTYWIVDNGRSKNEKILRKRISDLEKELSKFRNPAAQRKNPPEPKVEAKRPESPPHVGPDPSSGIRKAEYKDYSLYVTFGNGESYMYYGVSETVCAEVVQNPSNIKYFMDAIDGRYPFLRV